jgi:hypothetical protein
MQVAYLYLTDAHRLEQLMDWLLLPERAALWRMQGGQQAQATSTGKGQRGSQPQQAATAGQQQQQHRQQQQQRGRRHRRSSAAAASD